MKLFVISIIVAFSLSGSEENSSKKVYLCNGSMSTKYHLTPNCRGLQRCTTQLETTTLKEAKAKGRTLCGYERQR